MTDHNPTTAELIEAALKILNYQRAPSQAEHDAYKLIKIAFDRIPQLTIKLDQRVAINGVSVYLYRNAEKKKFRWSIGGVQPNDTYFDSAVIAFADLKQELSRRGLICLLTFDGSAT